MYSEDCFGGLIPACSRTTDWPGHIGRVAGWLNSVQPLGDRNPLFYMQLVSFKDLGRSIFFAFYRLLVPNSRIIRFVAGDFATINIHGK